ncbi:MAG: hypothetical protein KAI61_06010 [Alphaproteobacteria bacterium]|nr:hypothetical protein [Alphaproteobacteria bacterium]MCK5659202.1 hypothetical protein [Alphaproteobacteria bacterium]
MTAAHLLLILLFLLTIGHLLTLKVCSVKLDHRTAPIFISIWTLLGIAGVSPVFGHLWAEGWEKFMAEPHLLALSVLKGCLLYLLFVISQELIKESLSSNHYVRPMSIGLIAIVNSTLGEQLNMGQWFAALGLCVLSAAFFFKGHLSDLSRRGKITYIKLVVLSVFLSSLDHVLTKNSNWFSLLLVSNTVLLFLSLALNRKRIAVLKDALFHKAALLAGFFFMATELVKFYQMVSINPVSVVVTVQAATTPVILVLSAFLWKERTVREQLVWGVLAFIVSLALFL